MLSKSYVASRSETEKEDIIAKIKQIQTTDDGKEWIDREVSVWTGVVVEKADRLTSGSCGASRLERIINLGGLWSSLCTGSNGSNC